MPAECDGLTPAIYSVAGHLVMDASGDQLAQLRFRVAMAFLARAPQSRLAESRELSLHLGLARLRCSPCQACRNPRVKNHRWRTGPGEIRRCRDPELRAAGQPVRRAFRNGPHRPGQLCSGRGKSDVPTGLSREKPLPRLSEAVGVVGAFLIGRREGGRERQVNLAVAEWCREGR